MRRWTAKHVIGLVLLVVANIVVFATESLAFLWPVMGLVDAGSLTGLGRPRPRRR